MSLECRGYGTTICLRLFCLNLLVVGVLSSRSAIPITKGNCKESCENSIIKIPYPFGIGPGCYHNPWYEIICNSSSLSSSNSSMVYKPFLRKLELEVLQISSCFTNQTNYYCSPYDLTLVVAGQWQRVCTSDIGNSSQQVNSIDLKGSPFSITPRNGVVATLEQGCSGQIVLMNRSNNIIGGCSSICPKRNSTIRKKNATCDGVDCCLIPLVYFYPTSSNWGSDFYSVGLTDEVANTCMNVAIMESFTDDNMAVEQISSSSPVRTVLQWEAPKISNISSYFLRNDSCDPSLSCELGFCAQSCHIRPYQQIMCEIDCFNNECLSACTCSDGYEGNPYLPDGCQEISEGSCHGAARHSLHCKETVETDGDGKTSRARLTPFNLVVFIGYGLSFAFVPYVLYIIIKRQWRKRQRSIFFKRNGGLLLQQQMTYTEGVVERAKLFTAKELDKATQNFSANRILGQGGQGTVYKGMLFDGRIVAIKKSKKVDESQIEQFINEVVILSQINHRNVVKLLGCCLETEVPLLVYEFIQNGTLSKQIHDPSDDFYITWKMRLQIAAESAGAIAYLHSSSATPIYHRDIKSSNILLDEKYRAKVSDFGISRTITVDQTHLTTCVQGTLGYLDPEYFQTNQYTEKSDVYSFGVVLIELMTSKKPLTPTRSGGWKSLAMEFLFHMENSSLFDIIDNRVSLEAKDGEIMAVASLAMRCLNLSGKQRPSMKAVTMELERIAALEPSKSMNETHVMENNVVMEMSIIQGDYGSHTHIASSSLGNDNGIDSATSCSVEIQPVGHNTL